MNNQLIDTLIQIIRSLSKEERNLLEEKLFFDTSEPSTRDLMKIAEQSGSFSFLEDEPDIYTLEDGEPI
ncbi:MAG: hypothetical protein QNJ54_30765 [Prochloraceae cyanobacterium]|nr:hypothetical protein [Prochloraceae cyanobacterium]